MMYEKRVASTTVWGLIFGFVLWAIARIPGAIPVSGAVGIVLSLTLLGFVMGISAWKIAWWLHGILLGLFFGIPVGFFAVCGELGWGRGFLLAVIGGIVFGFLIELLTTVFFKAGMRKAKVEERKEEKKKE